MSKLSDKINSYRAVTNSRDGVPFFQASLNAYKKDPSAYDSMLDTCRTIGKARAKQFLDSVRNPEHPQHDKNFKTYGDKFGRNEKSVYDHFVNDEMTDSNTFPVQYRNESYENKILVGFTAGTNDDESIVTNFRNLMLAKWNACGYKNDDQEIADYFNAYPLTNKSKMSQYVNKVLSDPASGANAPGGGRKAAY